MTSKAPITLEDRAASGARLSSPSAGRNRDVIAAALAARLPEGARVLEIASGTGEHALACVTARPDLDWRPGDPDAASRASIDGWAEEAAGRIAPALDVDTRTPGWADGRGPVEAVFCANMIHIAPWEACEGLFAGAAEILAPGGALILYGPFLEGAATAPSNLEFDASLKRRDPGWGVRALADLDALGARLGMERVERAGMPANNLIVVWRRRA
jgi:hypothetical protein